MGPVSWLAMVALAVTTPAGGPSLPYLPQAARQLLGLLIAFGAIPRMVFGPVLLVIEGVTFLLVRLVDGDVAAIWEFGSEDEESECLACWIGHEVQAGNIEPHDVAILVRMRADEVEARLLPAFEARDLKVRNVARNVGDIAIQDLLGEDLTQMLLRLLRLGAAERNRRGQGPAAYRHDRQGPTGPDQDPMGPRVPRL